MQRTERRYAARLMAAKLPPGQWLDRFGFAPVPDLSCARIDALCTSDWCR